MRADTAHGPGGAGRSDPPESMADGPRRPRRRSPSLAGPERTCVGCRRRGLRADLLRVVLDPAAPMRVVADERRSAPGRGGWLHPERACLDLAQHRRAFRRAFRLAFDPDTSELDEWMKCHEGEPATHLRADEPSSPGKRVGS